MLSLYKPFNDLTLRGTYSESFVAPSLITLFTAPQIAETTLVDPKNPSAGQETVLNATTGINNIFDTAAPFAVDAVLTNYDPGSGANNIRRYFWASVDKKF